MARRPRQRSASASRRRRAPSAAPSGAPRSVASVPAVSAAATPWGPAPLHDEDDQQDGAVKFPGVVPSPTNTQPLTKPVIFSLIWMLLIVLYLFTGPRNYGPVPVELSFLLVGTTIFSLIVLGKRFPLFGYFTIIIFCSLFSALVGGRRGRR